MNVSHKSPKQHLQPLTCGSFLENTILPPPLVVNKDEFLVFVGTLLSSKDAACAVIKNEKGVYESIYGYQIVNILMESKPDELYDQLYKPVSKCINVVSPSTLPVVRLDDGFAKALTQMGINRFGDVMVLDDKGTPSGMFSLSNIVAFLSGRTDSIGMRLRDVSSELKLVDGEDSVIEVFRFMMRNRLRRAVIKRGEAFYCCTEREAIRGIFSFKGLNSLKDNPDAILNMPVEQLVRPFLSEVPSLNGSLDVAKAWVHAAFTSNCTLIVDDQGIATPWDLIMKPFQTGMLPL